jgi:hypothetical protein
LLITSRSTRRENPAYGNDDPLLQTGRPSIDVNPDESGRKRARIVDNFFEFIALVFINTSWLPSLSGLPISPTEFRILPYIIPLDLCTGHWQLMGNKLLANHLAKY